MSQSTSSYVVRYVWGRSGHTSGKRTDENGIASSRTANPKPANHAQAYRDLRNAAKCFASNPALASQERGRVQL